MTVTVATVDNKTEFRSSKTFIACMILKTSAGDGIAKNVWGVDIRAVSSKPFQRQKIAIIARMFYNRVFEKNECFIIEFACISSHVINLLHLTSVL